MLNIDNDNVILEATANYGLLYGDKINVGFLPHFASANTQMGKEIKLVNDDAKLAYLEIIKLARNYVALFSKSTPKESIPLLHSEIDSILEKYSWYDELYCFEGEPRQLVVKSLNDTVIIYYHNLSKKETYNVAPILSSNYKGGN